MSCRAENAPAGGGPKNAYTIITREPGFVISVPQDGLLARNPILSRKAKKDLPIACKKDRMCVLTKRGGPLFSKEIEKK